MIEEIRLRMADEDLTWEQAVKIAELERLERIADSLEKLYALYRSRR